MLHGGGVMGGLGTVVVRRGLVRGFWGTVVTGRRLFRAGEAVGGGLVGGVGVIRGGLGLVGGVMERGLPGYGFVRVTGLVLGSELSVAGGLGLCGRVRVGRLTVCGLSGRVQVRRLAWCGLVVRRRSGLPGGLVGRCGYVFVSRCVFAGGFALWYGPVRA
ncbi:MAG: hypothetical protein K0R62_8141 [Nonomuraea muscovyensis]|nr:hypothetical protein [Nonomuraea muscovyensis]